MILYKHYVQILRTLNPFLSSLIAIFGYSRLIIWIHEYYTNKDPRVIAGYFMVYVSKHKIYPRWIGSDTGKENGSIEQIQKFLQINNGDEHAGDKSFIYGSSVNNQRIEWMWGMFRREGVQYWINFLQKIADEGNFTGGYVDKHLIRICFMDMIRVGSIMFGRYMPLACDIECARLSKN